MWYIILALGGQEFRVILCYMKSNLNNIKVEYQNVLKDKKYSQIFISKLHWLVSKIVGIHRVEATLGNGQLRFL